jgi:type VI secretion system secreted protein Hcp
MAFDAFLKLDGIQGESQDKVHSGEIEIESFSWGATNPTTGASGGGGGTGKVSFQDLHFTMPTSTASPNLMLACATGRHIRTATLTCRKAGGTNALEFMKIKLSDCLVSSYSNGSHVIDTGFSALAGNEDLPSDQMSLNFLKIDFLYTSQSTGETVETSFDAGGNVTGG